MDDVHQIGQLQFSFLLRQRSDGTHDASTQVSIPGICAGHILYLSYDDLLKLHQLLGSVVDTVEGKNLTERTADVLLGDASYGFLEGGLKGGG